MGLSTVAIGLLPTYETIGIAAPALLALCRFGQGIGLGGEWGGAVLLATENAPPGQRAWYGMFPQLGAPIGFFGSGAIFLLLSRGLSDEQFLAWGWRVPFLASAVLVILGLYVRLSIAETPVFRRAMERHERVQVPILRLFARNGRELVLGTLIGLSVYVNFYLMTVFTLSWATTALGYSREQFLFIQLFGVLFFAIAVPWSAVLADTGRRRMLMTVNVGMLLFGLAFAPLFLAGTVGAAVAVSAGMLVMGLGYGPLGTVLAELFPTTVRYTGASLTYNLAGIFGASLAPYVATWLATRYSLHAVGYYLSASTLVSLIGLWMSRETRDEVL
jgi:MFS family permease